MVCNIFYYVTGNNGLEMAITLNRNTAVVKTLNSMVDVQCVGACNLCFITAI